MIINKLVYLEVKKMYKANKMGLLNFWLYDDEEFYFGDGKLLLRGQNGSGKSVTMQSFIPLILDGNKSPKRLDTFGSSDKHIEYYILGEDKDESTGYLYMEFYDEELDKYITIGMSLHSKRGRNTDFVGFCLKDGKRVNENGFHLYKCNDGIHKIPLTKLELKSAIGPENYIVATSKEYKEMVNNLLFGFNNVESFDEFINLLLQIRSPKLSKEYTPTMLMNTLNEVLPPLNDDEVMPLSEGIQNMNEYKEKLEKTKQDIKNLNGFITSFNNYNKGILKRKTKNLIVKHDNLNDVNKKLKELNSELENKNRELALLKEDNEKLDQEYNYAKAKRETINLGDLEEKASESNKLSLLINSLEEQIKDIRQKIQNLYNQKNNILEEIDNLNKEEKSYKDAIEKYIKGLNENAALINFNQFINALNSENLEKINVKYLEKILGEKIDTVNSCLELLKQKNNIIYKQDVANSKYMELTKKQDELNVMIKKLSSDIENELEDLIRKINALKDTNTVLLIDDDSYVKIINLLDSYDKDKYLDAKKCYENCASSIKNQYQLEINDYKVKIDVINNSLEILCNELDELLNAKDITLPEDNFTLENNVKLKDLNIPYTYFYKVVDFKNDVSEKEKQSLEEALYSSGILGAKIIDVKFVNKVKDININYLVPSNKKKYNLAKYLIPVDNDIVTNDYIESILESISVSNDDDINVSLDGYRFDFYKGLLSNDYENKYIGLIARQKLRKKKIDKLNEEIEINKKKIDSLNSLVNGVVSRINKVDEEILKFPSDDTLSRISEEIYKNQLKLDNYNEDASKLMDELSVYQKEINELNIKISDYNGEIPLTLPSYENARNILRNVENDTNSLQREVNNFNNVKRVIWEKNKRYNSLEEIINDYNNNMNKLKNDLNDSKVKKKAIDDVLYSEENNNIREEISKLDTIINTYNSKSNKLYQLIGKLEQGIESVLENIRLTNDSVKVHNELYEIAKKILIDELNLGYIKYLELDINMDKDFGIKDVIKLNKMVEDINIDDMELKYNQAINNYRQDLIDYNLRDTYIFNESAENFKGLSESILSDEQLSNELDLAKRRNVSFSYQGKMADCYSLLGSLTDKYDVDKTYLDEQDKRIFYDILVKTTGEKIKQKIMLAEDWVNKTNKIMQEHGKDSKLSFYLEWHPKDAEAMDEMNTKDLVTLFKRDSGTIRDEDIDRLVKHFRNKIDKAEEFGYQGAESYFQIIFDILDYRTWFEFKLFYKKDDSPKKELTNKIFSVFSGGEKAKTMYVPLFASVYAKLDGAKKNAPRLIAMDEAFAGVDEQNIEEMFGILNSFNLDYLLTSQALWCTYSNIKNINISELIHPRGSKCIGIHRYNWNGLVKTYIVNEVV